MKKFKVFLGTALLCFVAILVFSTTNVSQGKGFNPGSVSGTCPLKIFLSSGTSCLTGTYTYCINNGSPVTVTSDTLIVLLNEGATSTICVENSSHTCSGTLSYYMPSPCPGYRDTTMILGKGGACNCTAD